MNKLQNIQALRGAAVLFVVVFHLTFIETRYGGTGTILPGWLHFGMFGVDLFFVISGFVMVTVTRGKFQNIRQSLLFLYHRVSRIYPLYWVYTTLALVVFLIQPTWVNSSQGGQVNILASYLLIPDQVLPLVQVSWTLIHEIYFYLVFFIILLVSPERIMPIFILVWGLVIAFFGGMKTSPMTYIIFHPLTLEFLAGCLLAWLYHKYEQKISNAKVLVALGLVGIFAAIVGFNQYFQQTGTLPLDWHQALLYGIPATWVVFCFTQAERHNMILPNFLTQIGNASYSIYLSHLFTINVVGKLWNLMATDSIVDNLVALPITFVATLLVGFISYWYIEIPLLNLTRKLA